MGRDNTTIPLSRWHTRELESPWDQEALLRSADCTVNCVTYHVRACLKIQLAKKALRLEIRTLCAPPTPWCPDYLDLMLLKFC